MLETDNIARPRAKALGRSPLQPVTAATKALRSKPYSGRKQVPLPEAVSRGLTSTKAVSSEHSSSLSWIPPPLVHFSSLLYRDTLGSASGRAGGERPFSTRNGGRRTTTTGTVVHVRDSSRRAVAVAGLPIKLLSSVGWEHYHAQKFRACRSECTWN